MVVKFPDDFKFKDESVEYRKIGVDVEKYHWTFPIDALPYKHLISIIGGDHCWGDGYSTFELFDSRERDVRSYLTLREVNQHLIDNPFSEDQIQSSYTEDE